MIEISTRKRNQIAPPFAIFDALSDPTQDTWRPWLRLRNDEVIPRVLRSEHPALVVWSSLWPAEPDAEIRFDLPWDKAGEGTDLRWTLFVNEMPPESSTKHWRFRLNELINRDLRSSFDY